MYAWWISVSHRLQESVHYTLSPKFDRLTPDWTGYPENNSVHKETKNGSSLLSSPVGNIYPAHVVFLSPDHIIYSQS